MIILRNMCVIRVCIHVCVFTYLMYHVEFINVSRCAYMHVICAYVSLNAHIEYPGVHMCSICIHMCVCVCILPSVYFHYIF